MRPVASFFAAPTAQAERLPIRAAFCSSWDSQGHCIFDPQYFPYQWWRWKVHGDEAARDRFYGELRRKVRNGITHVVLDPPDGTVYDGDRAVPELPDWISPRGDLHLLFIEMCHEVLAIVPFAVFYCFGGGQHDAPSIYNGRLARMAQRIKAEGWTKRLIVAWAWESFGRNPECTGRQNADAWQVLAENLGEGYLIAEHVGSNAPQRATWASSYGAGSDRPLDARGRPCVWKDGHGWIEQDDPSKGDEPGAHYAAGGIYPGVFFGQLELKVPQPRDYAARLIEILDRFLPKGTPIPCVGQGDYRRDKEEDGSIDDRPIARGPDWFGAPRLGGRMHYCMWEPGIPFTAIRGLATPQDVEHTKTQMDAFGIVSQGCLPVGE